MIHCEGVVLGLLRDTVSLLKLASAQARAYLACLILYVDRDGFLPFVQLALDPYAYKPVLKLGHGRVRPRLGLEGRLLVDLRYFVDDLVFEIP